MFFNFKVPLGIAKVTQLNLSQVGENVEPPLNLDELGMTVRQLIEALNNIPENRRDNHIRIITPNGRIVTPLAKVVQFPSRPLTTYLMLQHSQSVH